MTTNDTLQHPVTDKVVHLAIGFVAAKLLQHGIDLQEHMDTIGQFFSSSQGSAAIVAVIALFNAVKTGMAQKQAAGTPLVATFNSTYQPSLAETVSEVIKILAAKNAPAAQPATASVPAPAQQLVAAAPKAVAV